MNVKLLRKVQEHILEEPKRFSMQYYCRAADGPDAPPCGTVGCIGGWAHLLSLKRAPKQLWTADAGFEQGKKSLKLTEKQAIRLFRNPIEPHYDRSSYPDGPPDGGWPRRFALRFLKAVTNKQRAKIASARIDHFIKTKGKE